MATERDRFGDKLRDKEKAEEDRFFAERDKAALEKLRTKLAETDESSIRDLAKGHCPKCGTRLTPVEMEGVTIDRCDSCRGIWLDDGELAALSKKDSSGWLSRMFKKTIEDIR